MIRIAAVVASVLILSIAPPSPASGAAVVAPRRRPPLNLPCFSVDTRPGGGAELPLCGNGRLDPGETCDDGNRNDGDGCAALCSHFDAMPAAATLAGSTNACPTGDTPMLVRVVVVVVVTPSKQG
jgi:cysteine-rich repeat protein